MTPTRNDRLRLLFSGAGGLFIALALLWLMQRMVIHDDPQAISKPERPVMEFVRLKRPPETRLKQRQPPQPPPPPPRTPPPQPGEPTPDNAPPAISAPGIEMALPGLPASSLRFDGPYIGAVRQGASDRDFMVLSRIPPRYPYRAERRKIEGWVKVSFLITGQGTVQDAVVVDAHPEGIFDQAALRAILKWRFKPRIRDGRPVATRADQIIHFRLNRRAR